MGHWPSAAWAPKIISSISESNMDSFWDACMSFCVDWSLVVADKLFHIAADNEPIVEKAIQERSPKTKTETNNEKQAYTHIYTTDCQRARLQRQTQRNWVRVYWTQWTVSSCVTAHWLINNISDVHWNYAAAYTAAAAAAAASHLPALQHQQTDENHTWSCHI